MIQADSIHQNSIVINIFSRTCKLALERVMIDNTRQQNNRSQVWVNVYLKLPGKRKI